MEDAPNLLERDFKAEKPNQKWATDVTEFALFGIKLYLSPIIDLYNCEVVSYNLSRHPNLNQVINMLEKAFSKIPDNTNLILHSDQGWQYQHRHYHKMLRDKCIGKVCPERVIVLTTPVLRISLVCSKLNCCIYRNSYLLSTLFQSLQRISTGTTTNVSNLSLMECHLSNTNSLLHN